MLFLFHFCSEYDMTCYVSGSGDLALQRLFPNNLTLDNHHHLLFTALGMIMIP